jgi:hypothetical protein
MPVVFERALFVSGQRSRHAVQLDHMTCDEVVAEDPIDRMALVLLQVVERQRANDVNIGLVIADRGAERLRQQRAGDGRVARAARGERRAQQGRR